MASKSEYLKKYLKSKGAPRARGAPPPSGGGLKLQSDDEPDVRLEKKVGGPRGAGGPGKKSLFQVLRRAADGERYLFKDSDAESLPDSDEEEVKVVGEDGQLLVLSEEDKKKVAELIANEEGRNHRPDAWGAPGAPPKASTEEQQNYGEWKRAFAIDQTPKTTKPSSAPTPYDSSDPIREDIEPGDLSPPRRETRDKDLSPPRRRTDKDLSPPRERQQDLSPPRRDRRDEDLSPPRRDRSDKDLSPPRMRTDGDQSSPRRDRRGEDLSPPRRRQQDLSPPRRDRRNEDLSPPRRQGGGGSKGLDLEVSSEAPGAPPRSAISPPQKDAADRDAGQKIVFRDREGRIISEEEWLTLEGAKGRKRQRERGPAPVLEWGTGLKQKEDKKAKMRDEEKLAKQPFSRYEIDEEYDADLRARDRWDDPLAKAPSSKNEKSKLNLKEDEEENRQKKPVCPHDAPPNRFGIKPGYRWDGVVRGNGYEEERLKAVNRRKREAEMAHANNTADM